MGQTGVRFPHRFCLTIDPLGPAGAALLHHNQIQKEGYASCLKRKFLLPQPMLRLPRARPANPPRLPPAAPARRGRPPLAPELYVEMGGEQYNITDIIDRAKADYRTTHKVGVQSCKVYVKPEEGAAYYVINKFSGKLEL